MNSLALVLTILTTYFALEATALHLPPLPDLEKSCIECTALLKGLDVVFGNSTKVEEMVEKVNEKCGSHNVCKKLADALIKIPASIFAGLDKEGWPDWGLCSFVGECKSNCCNPLSSPEQVHLSLAADPHSMAVSWVTLEGDASVVEFGTDPHKLTSKAEGTTLTYSHGGWVGVIHRATMTSLEEDKVYYYRVGDGEKKWSETFHFKTIPTAPTRSLVYAIVADMGAESFSDDTIRSLTSLADEGKIDVVVHTGDIGYADGYQRRWDDMMNKIQPIASRVPYMVAPGNHEFGWAFAAYKARFFMPTPSSEMDYSWKAGKVSFVSLSSETAIDTPNISKETVAFAEKALATIDRAATPWVVVNFHRPLYCTEEAGRCDKDASKLRNQIEDTLSKTKVDFCVSGHVHAYQRSEPVYQSKVSLGAPVYLMQGASGNHEGNKGPYSPDQPDWIANSQNDVGYGLLTVDGTTAEWQFIRSSDGTILDKITYSK